METIELEKRGPVAWVWLNRPRRANVMDPTMFGELHRTFEALDGDDTVRAIVLAARGKAFSVGFDISWMAGLDLESIAEGIDSVRTMYDVIEACTRPLIVAVHGPAVGGGLLLALVADFCLASEQATFGAPEVKIGFFPPLDLIPRLERWVGVGAAKRIVLTGDLIDATEAQRIGLVGRIVPADTLHREAQSLAERLAALPPTGVQSAKSAFAVAQGENYREWETEQLAVCWESPERQVAMEMFLKRQNQRNSG